MASLLPFTDWRKEFTAVLGQERGKKKKKKKKSSSRECNLIEQKTFVKFLS